MEEEEREEGSIMISSGTESDQEEEPERREKKTVGVRAYEKFMGEGWEDKRRSPERMIREISLDKREKMM